VDVLLIRSKFLDVSEYGCHPQGVLSAW
jgi:hypothetical protein